MKNYFSGSWAMSGLFILLAACDNFVAFIPPAKTPVFASPAQTLLHTSIPVDSAQLHITEADTLNLPDSVVLILPKLCVSKKGSDEPCNCVVDVHVALLTSKKEMLLFGKPTTSATDLLETGGQALLTILHNGDTMQMRKDQKFTLKIPVKRTKTDYRKMLFFTENSTDIWAAAGQLTHSSPEYYTITSNQLDTWLSPAYVHTSGAPNVRIALQSSGDGPEVTKAQIFVVPTKVHAVVPATLSGGVFVPIAALPLEQEATMVALAKEGETLWLGMKKVNLAPTMDVSIEFKSVTLQQLNEALSTL